MRALKTRRPYASLILYHLKILLGGAALTGFFNLLWAGQLVTDETWLTLILIIFQLEIYLFIASRIFAGGPARSRPLYKRSMLIRLAVYFFIVFIITIPFGMLAIDPSASLKEMVSNLMSREWKTFFISWMISAATATAVFFYLEWANALKHERKLREERLIFRYETLKSQVNPHFLFNSLNTLSGLITENPALSEEFITKLASIYRYILENVDKQWVSLSDELAFVERFLFLHEIRGAGKVKLEINIANAAGYTLLPISLQLLVENAIKHNAATEEVPLLIQIYFDRDALIVENSIHKRLHLEPSSGMGLANLAERIKLMMNRDLVVKEDREKFRVELPLNVSHAGIDH